MSEKVTFDFNNAKVLAQASPSNADAQALYTPASRTKALIKGILVSNHDTSACQFSLYLDSDGSNTANVNSLYKTIAINANTTEFIEFDFGLPIQSGGTLSCQAQHGDHITFTVYGIEYQTSNGG